MNKYRLSREQLYKLVWTETLGSLAMKWSTPIDELKWLCLELNIPIPKPGDWTQVRFSKSVTPEPLPTKYSGKKWVTFPLANNDNEYDPLQERVDEFLIEEDRVTIDKYFKMQQSEPNRWYY